jgi:DNA-binding NarL/FixJ family response regulator
MLFSIVRSVLVVVQPTCIRLKMAEWKLQMELSLQQRSEVLQHIQKGESQRKLAEQFSMSKTTIKNIKNMNTSL